MSDSDLNDLRSSNSGVIDLQAMAAAYERDEDSQPEIRPHVDLPLSAHTLVPSRLPPQRRSGKTIAAIAGGTVLLIAATAFATVMAVRVAGGGVTAEPASPDPASDRTALNDTAPVATEAPAAAPEPAATAAPDEIEVEEDLLAAAPSEPTRTVADETPRTRDRTSPRSDEPAIARAEPVVAPAPEPEPAPTPEPATIETPKPAPSLAEKATETTTCDEVTCLVDPSGPCCAALGHAPQKEKVETEDKRSDLPESLTRHDLAAGLRSHTGRIESCGDRHGFSGTANVKLQVSPEGRVKSVATSAGSAEFQACVASKVKSARFKETQNGASLRYPLIFR